MTQLGTSEIPGGFTEKTPRVNGVTLTYAIGGAGPAVVLLHGYPQTWYMWRKVMTGLARQCTVIAPDLCGSGGSDAPATGYDKAGLAEDVHQLLEALGHADQVSLVGHDIGGTVSYAYAAAHPDSVRRLTMIEAPQFDESLYEFPSATPAGPGLWNFGFFILDNGLPERMVGGREDTWIAGFVDWLEVVKGAVDGDAVSEYGRTCDGPGTWRLRTATSGPSTATSKRRSAIAKRRWPCRCWRQAARALSVRSSPTRRSGTPATSRAPCSHAVTGSRRKARNSFSNTCCRSSTAQRAQKAGDMQLRYGLRPEPETVPGEGDRLAAFLPSTMA
jgi:pimeloyl-ACP methyl ester carboxylesterase